MEILFTPPALFIFFLGLFALILLYLRRYAAKGKEESKGAKDAYACGQKNYANYVNPDYRQFFRYAFVFTVLHVIALIVTTAPAEALWLPLVYVAVGVLTLVIIFRK